MICAQCGAELQRDAKFCTGCGVRNETAKRNLKRDLVIGLFVIAAFWGAFAVGGKERWNEAMERQQIRSQTPNRMCSTANVEAEVAAKGYLRAAQEGEGGTRYWVGGVERQSLYNVRDWEELGHGGIAGNSNASFYTFRISSSTKGGFPVNKRWHILIRQDGARCAVYEIREAQ